jgi:enamine deaminase RidA (YjgF/YER057c/UK114 family)
MSGSAGPLARLAELGLELPQVATPAGAYLPARRTGSLVFTAGQLPLVGGALPATGKVGGTVDPDTAADLARTCALNALAAVHSLVGLDAVTGVIKVVGFVASAPGFTGQPKVINGASDLLGEVFGEAGRHARSAVGVAELPLDAPVEIELVVEVGA